MATVPSNTCIRENRSQKRSVLFASFHVKQHPPYSGGFWFLVYILGGRCQACGLGIMLVIELG